jgi:hypothetical protein
MSDTPQVLLAYHLKALKLPTFLREYDKVARQCAAEGVDYPRFGLASRRNLLSAAGGIGWNKAPQIQSCPIPPHPSSGDGSGLEGRDQRRTNHGRGRFDTQSTEAQQGTLTGQLS